MKPILTPAALLAQLLSAPPLVRGDYLAALIFAAVSPRGSGRELRTNTGLAAANNGAPDDCPPWEEPLYRLDGTTAVLDVCGPLYNGLDPVTCWYFGLASYERIQAACRELAQNPAVTDVVFNFNSPGGMSSGCPETAEIIAALGEVKGTVAYTSSQCCSAAYWLASQCLLVLAAPSASVGSIGTYLAFYSYVEWLKQEGIELHLFRAGDLKGIGVFGKELTPAEAAFLDSVVQRSNDRFHAGVLFGRGPIAESTMQGQWFDGEQAKDLGLVDETVNSLAELLAQFSPPAAAAPGAPSPEAPVRPATKSMSPTATPAASGLPDFPARKAATGAAREAAAGEIRTGPGLPAGNNGAPIHITVNMPAMSFAAPQVTTHVDARLEKDSIAITNTQHQAGSGPKKIVRDANGAITGLVRDDEKITP